MIKIAYIYGLDNLIQRIEYTSFTSEIIEQAYFFMNEKDNVAIIPYKYLIIFDNPKQ